MKTEIKLTTHLTESLLAEVLDKVFEGCQINKQVRLEIGNNVHKTAIVDYMVVTKHGKLIVEFNGHFHYQKGVQQHRDYLLRDYCAEDDIMLVEIPYFIQLDSDSAYMFFPNSIVDDYLEKFEITTTFPHGFVHPKCVLPCDFNIEGWDRFVSDYAYCLSGYNNDCEMWPIMQRIYESLENKIEFSKYKDPITVLGCMRDLTGRMPDTFLEHYPT